VRLGLRDRLAAVAAVVAVTAVSSGLYLQSQRAERDREQRSAAPVATTALTSIEYGPHIVFRSTALGPTYGKVAMVSTADPGGERGVTTAECERVYATRQLILCLAADRGIAVTYSATVLDASWRTVRPLQLAGIASRARLSPDGSLAATTTFVSGHSYSSASFYTQTLVSPVAGHGQTNLEDFALVHRGRRINPKDRNIWGVTFAGDDTFYATVAWGGHTWLTRGSIAERTLTTLRSDAECPSVSPDGTHVAYKKRAGQPAGHWRVAVLDLATGTERLLAERRSVDDQVEWLDARSVMYGLPRTGAQAGTSDVWRAPADGSGKPELLIAGAWSPAVVR